MDDRGHAAVAHLLAAQGKDSTAGLLARHAARPRVARGAGADRFGGVTLDTLQYLLGGLSGGIVGFTLGLVGGGGRSEEHTSELQSLMRISYAVFCLQKKKHYNLISQDIHF